MAQTVRYRLTQPKCRFCGRDWTPPQYVSAEMSFCSECREERVDLVRQQTTGFIQVTGKNGELAVIPIKA